jgi:hypothetical protein
MERIIKVGQMPGRIVEVLVGENTTIAQAIELAGFEKNGYEVKVDSNVVTNLDTTVGNANYIILAKPVKGA